MPPELGSSTMSSNSREGLMDVQVQQDEHATAKAPFSDNAIYCCGDYTADDLSMIFEGAEDNLLPLPLFTQTEEKDDVTDVKSTKDRTNSPPITIEQGPVIVTPSRVPPAYAASIMDSISNNTTLKEIKQSFTCAFQTCFRQMGPRRDTCLESTTSIGWFPNGTYVEGPFDPATYSFGDGLDRPSALYPDETNTIWGIGITAVSFDADVTEGDTQGVECQSPTDPSMPDAMDISVTSFESLEELDSKPPAEIPAIGSNNPSLDLCKIYAPCKSVTSPPENGGKIISNLRDHLRKQESSSSMSSSAHESFSSAQSSAYMSANEDGDSLVSIKRRIRWSDPDIKEYDTPREEDVLLGRGGRSNNHPGNKVYRQRILIEQPIYQALPNRKKQEFSQMIIDWVHHECNGRFMKKDEFGWFEANLKNTLLKVSQALREDHSADGKKRKKEKQKTKKTGGKNKRNRRTTRRNRT